MAYLRREGRYAEAPLPKLILLDLNLPKVDGREILGYLKSEGGLLSIPTVVITASECEADVEKCYQFRANCYIQKPKHLDAFRDLVHDINRFWLPSGAASEQTLSL
jgi:CheY-like chemotaxis protein